MFSFYLFAGWNVISLDLSITTVFSAGRKTELKENEANTEKEPRNKTEEA